MNFNQPQAFWLLLLLIVPVIIHLFQFRKYKKLLFSNVAFLKQVDDSKKQKRTLKHLLILLSRLLFLFFIILCLTDPFLPANQSRSLSSLAIVDNSPSSETILEGTVNTVLEEQINVVNQLSEQFGALALQFIDGIGNTIQPFVPVDINSSLTDMPLSALLESNKASNQILLFSDFQKHIIDDNLVVLKDTSYQFVLIPAHKEMPLTVQWDSVWVAGGGGVAVNDELVVKATLPKTENTRGSSTISVIENEEYIGNSTLTYDRNELQEGNFSLPKNLTESVRKIILNADDKATIFDNDFYITIQQQTPVEVAYLYMGQPNDFIQALFETNELFEYSEANIRNYSFQNLKRFEVIVADLTNDISTQAIVLLKQFVEGGGSLVLIPQPDFNNFNLLEQLNFEQVVARTVKEQAELSNPDFKNPFFENVFKRQDESIDMPTGRPILEWSSSALLLKYPDGSPFLGKAQSVGDIFLFSSPLTDAFTSFTRSALFLPVFYRMTLTKQKESVVHYYFLDNEVIDISHLKIPGGVVVKLTTDDIAIIPDQRAGAKKLIIEKNTLKSGFYEVVDAKTDVVYGAIGLNYPRKESAVGFYTVAELSEMFADQTNIKVIDDLSAEEIGEYIIKSKNGFPLWKYFLIVALLSLLAEVLIIRFFK